MTDEEFVEIDVTSRGDVANKVTSTLQVKMSRRQRWLLERQTKLIDTIEGIIPELDCFFERNRPDKLWMRITIDGNRYSWWYRLDLRADLVLSSIGIAQFFRDCIAKMAETGEYDQDEYSIRFLRQAGEKDE